MFSQGNILTIQCIIYKYIINKTNDFYEWTMPLHYIDVYQKSLIRIN